MPLWRTRALLKTWWDAGASPAGLLYAIDRHPDQPAQHRGDALRGTRDPLRVLGARLRPWRDRLHELPATVVGLHGDYLAAQRAALAQRTGHAADSPQTFLPTSSAEARSGARRAVQDHLDHLRRRRSARTAGTDDQPSAEPGR